MSTIFVMMNFRFEITEEMAHWCHYYYKDNLAGLAFYNPAAVNQGFPCGDINLLLLLNEAPADALNRYKAIETILKNLAPGYEFVCRIQTVDEIRTLAALQLPLLAIYLQESEIVYDPQGVLQTAQATLVNNTTPPE
jgi:hypothetical protein